MFASLCGASYFMMLQPHTMYMIACSGISLFSGIGLMNYKMNKSLSVADAQLNQDGEIAELIMYDGRAFFVPIKDLHFLTHNNRARVTVKINYEDG